MRILALHSCLALTCLALSPPAEVHASPSPADSVHFCAFDHEQWRPDHPRPAASRPAAKRLADLNVGEPRTVRMIYFLPNDWPYRAEVVDSMKDGDQASSDLLWRTDAGARLRQLDLPHRDGYRG